MWAIALLGGLGTRLRPLTNETPKQMLPVANRPMIEWVARHLARHGVTRLVLALGYKSQAFTEAFSDGTIAGLPFVVAVEPTALGTAGAVRFAADAAGVTQRCVVVNGDVLTDTDVSELVRFHARAHEHAGTAATISLQPVADPSAFGVVDLNERGKVLRFVEKPTPGTEPSNLANAGTYVLEPEVIAAIAADENTSIERVTFPALAARGELSALAQPCYWIDTGTPQLYLRANLDVLAGRRADVAIEDGFAVDGPLAGDVRASLGAHPTARVSSSFVGTGCSLAADVVIQRSVVMDGCVLGAGAVVRDSIVGPNVTLGAGSMVVEGSVVGAGEVVAAGAELFGARQPALA